MQRAQAEPAAERAVDRWVAERKQRAAFAGMTAWRFQRPELPAQLLDAGCRRFRRRRAQGCGCHGPGAKLCS
jgi:hypothetical protein